MHMIRYRLVEEARKFLGASSVKYRGPDDGVDPRGFDCSGFIVFLLTRVGFPLDKSLRHTNELFDSLGVFIHREALGIGDLVFWSHDGIVPRHIGIMFNATHFIHAPGRDGTRVEQGQLMWEPIQARKPSQIYFENPIGFKRLSIKIGRYQTVL